MAASILCLSPELIDIVVSNCDYATTLALSLTCRALHRRLINIKNQRYTMTDLLQIELWPCYDGAGRAEGCLKQPIFNRDYFACHMCLRIRATTKFSNAMMKGKRGKHCTLREDKQNLRLSRFCIDCGIRTGRYPPGTTFDFGGYRQWAPDEVGGGHALICQRCNRFERIEWATLGGTRICSSCYGSG